MNRGTAALALAIFDIVGYAVLSVWGMSIGPDMADAGSALIFGAAVVAFSVMGALLVRRVPNNPVGALLLAVPTALVAGYVVSMYAYFGTAATPEWPLAALAGAFGDLGYLAPYVLALIGIPLLFPDGRLPSRRFRFVVWVSAAALAAMLLQGLATLAPDLVDVETVYNVAEVIAFVAISVGFAGAGASVWVRFRRGDRVERQQLKWLLAVAGVGVTALPPAMLLNAPASGLSLALWAIGFLAFLALPVAIGVAVLRYHLYEIDVIINRALVYVPLTAMVAGFYAASITLVGRLLAAAGQKSDMAIVVTTLVVVVIFTPVKNAVQAAVDRRFKVVPPPAEVPVVHVDPTELLRKLADLHATGILTPDEFEMKKREILSLAWIK